MSKYFKQIVALLVSGVLCLSLIGCNKEQPQQKTDSSTTQTEKASTVKTDEKVAVTLTILGNVMAKHLEKGIEEDPVAKEVTNRTGVTMDFSPVRSNEDINKGLNLMLASGDLPDIVQIQTPELRTKVLAAKAAISLDSLVETNGPDLMKNHATPIKYSKLFRSDASQALYFIPFSSKRVIDPVYSEKGWYVRWDLYKKLGYPKLETNDDFLNVLKDMMKLEPTNKDGKKNYALGNFFGESWAWVMVEQGVLPNAGIAPAGTAVVSLDMKSNTMIKKFSDPDSIFWADAMKFYNKAYQMGILDPESVTLKFQEFMDKAKTGRYFAAVPFWILGGADSQFVTDGMPEKGFAPFLIGNANKDYAFIAESNSVGTASEFFITNKCKYPERAMDLINFFGSMEGGELLWNGVEGISYDMVDGVPILRDESYKAIANQDPEMIKKTGAFKYCNLAFREFQDPRGFNSNFAFLPETVQKQMTEVQRDFCNYNNIKVPTDIFNKITNKFADLSLFSVMSTDPGSDLQAKEAKIQTYLQSAIAKVIFQKTDADFEKEKAKMINDLKTMGIEELENYCIKKFEEAKAKIDATK